MEASINHNRDANRVSCSSKDISKPGSTLKHAFDMTSVMTVKLQCDSVSLSLSLSLSLSNTHTHPPSHTHSHTHTHAHTHTHTYLLYSAGKQGYFLSIINQLDYYFENEQLQHTA